MACGTACGSVVSLATRNYQHFLYRFVMKSTSFLNYGPIRDHKLYVVGMLRNRFCLFRTKAIKASSMMFFRGPRQHCWPRYARRHFPEERDDETSLSSRIYEYCLRSSGVFMNISKFLLSLFRRTFS